MPVTKTATRALRVSAKKKTVNDKLKDRLEITLRVAKKKPSAKTISEAFSAVDRAAKKNLMHKNKAARIKSQISKFSVTKAKPTSKTKKKKTSK